jgi:hypothetical protein
VATNPYSLCAVSRNGIASRLWMVSWTLAKQVRRIIVALSEPRPTGSGGARRSLSVAAQTVCQKTCADLLRWPGALA